MRKGFTRKPKADEPATPGKNYITPSGLQRLQDEHRFLLTRERPAVTEVVSWAAGNGDRSENADYQYGKKRLLEIDRRMRYLTRRLDSAVVQDTRQQQGLKQDFFGATVTYAKEDGGEHAVTLVGVDEADLSQRKISWLSPVAQALIKARVGDTVPLRAPSGIEEIEIVA